MRSPLSSRLAALLLPAALLASCGGPGKMIEVPAGQAEVALTIHTLSFEPSHVVVRAGGGLALNVRNDSGSPHNLTVADPDGRVLRSVDLGSGESARVELDISRPGVYGFYCAKTFHPTLGMRGRIEAR